MYYFIVRKQNKSAYITESHSSSEESSDEGDKKSEREHSDHGQEPQEIGQSCVDLVKKKIFLPKYVTVVNKNM